MFHCLQAQVNEDEDEDDVFKLFKTKSGKFSRHRHRLGQTGRFLRGKQQSVCLSRSRSSALEKDDFIILKKKDDFMILKNIRELEINVFIV